MPWEKLSLKVVAPAKISSLIISGVLVLGPRVATILVRRKGALTVMPAGLVESVAILTHCQLANSTGCLLSAFS